MPIYNNENRRNYVLRLKLDRIFALLISYTPNIKDTFKVHQAEYINIYNNGDEKLVKFTTELYTQQHNFIEQIVKEKDVIIFAVKKELEI